MAGSQQAPLFRAQGGRKLGWHNLEVSILVSFEDVLSVRVIVLIQRNLFFLREVSIVGIGGGRFVSYVLLFVATTVSKWWVAGVNAGRRGPVSICAMLRRALAPRKAPKFLGRLCKA